MHTPHALFRFVGKSLLNVVPYAAYGVPLPVGEFAFEVVPAMLKDVWAGLFQGEPDAENRATIEALAGLSEPEAAALAGRVAAEVAGDQPEEARRLVEGYLRGVPQAVQATLRRPADPTGSTIPARRTPQSADDLAPFFPARLPRFKAGDRPGNIDRELIRCLGVGGFGEVWLAFNPNFPNRPPVALKIPRDDAAELLRNEARLLARLEDQADALHPGIVRLLDTHLGADPPSLDYEYVDGFELTTLIRDWHAEGPGPDPLTVAGMVRDLAEIVGSAHRLKPPVVHRDLKPANVLVTTKPGGGYRYRVTDFGIGGLAAEREVSLASVGGAASRAASLVSAARGAHTPLYSPSRQVRGQPAHPSDDLFALGVIWHQALTGDFLGGCPTGSRWKKRLTLAGMPEPLVDLLESCFEDDPEARPADANHLASALTSLLRPAPAAPVPALKPEPPPAPQAPTRVAPAPAPRPFQRLYTDPPKSVTEPRLNSATEYFGRALKKQNAGDAAGAVRDYDEAIRLDPKHVLAYTNRGAARRALGDAAGAIRDYDEAIRLDPKHALAYTNRGAARHALGDAAGAVRDFDEAIRLDPKHAPAYNNRGELHWLSGQFDAAIRDCDKALEINPSYSLPLGTRGAAYRQMGDFARAEADLTEALRLQPEFPFAREQLEKARKKERS